LCGEEECECPCGGEFDVEDWDLSIDDDATVHGWSSKMIGEYVSTSP
jgi:hypothetical protein